MHTPKLQIIRRASFTATPWKNGGGITHEAIRVPAGGDTFRWRVSVAHIDASGPFSEFAEYNRKMVLLQGAGIDLRFGAKMPGPNIRIAPVEMKFNYEDYFKTTLKTGYETLIYDCMIGDSMLYQRADNIEAGWRVVQPILDAWADERVDRLPNYAAGSAGPSEADDLLQRDGRRWRPLSGDGKRP